MSTFLLVSLFVGLVGMFVSDYSNQQTTDKTIEAEKQLQEDAQEYTTSERTDQNRWNLDLWRLQNEYNLPVNQMNRLTDAGINSNAAAQSLLGGQSSFAPVGASNTTAHSASVPQGLPSSLGGLGSVMDNLFQNLESESRTNKNNSEIVFNRQMMKESDARIVKMCHDQHISDEQLKLARTINESQVNLNASQVELNYGKLATETAQFQKLIAEAGKLKAEEVRQYAEASLTYVKHETEKDIQAELRAKANMETNQAGYYSSMDQGQQYENLEQNMLNQFTAYRLEVSKILGIDVNAPLTTQIVEAAAMGQFETVQRLLIAGMSQSNGLFGVTGLGSSLGALESSNRKSKEWRDYKPNSRYNVSYTHAWNPTYQIVKQ